MVRVFHVTGTTETSHKAKRAVGKVQKSESGYKDKLDYHTSMRKEYADLTSAGYTMPYTFVTQPHVALTEIHSKKEE